MLSLKGALASNGALRTIYGRCECAVFVQQAALGPSTGEPMAAAAQWRTPSGLGPHLPLPEPGQDLSNLSEPTEHQATMGTCAVMQRVMTALLVCVLA